MSDFYPDLSFRYRHPPRTSPGQPQLLARPTWKGMEGLGCMGCDATPITRTMRGLLGLRALGEATEEGRVSPTALAVFSLLSLAGATTGAYHGYKRNNSLGWAVAWFFLGGWFPLLSIPVSLAQGYAKPKRGR